MRNQTIQWALREKVIAIVRGMEAKDALQVAQALYDGGIRLMEITYDQSNPSGWGRRTPSGSLRRRLRAA